MTYNHLLYGLLGVLFFTLYLTKKNAYQYKNFHTAYSKFDVTVFADIGLQVYCDVIEMRNRVSIHPQQIEMDGFIIGAPNTEFIEAAKSSQGFQNLIALLNDVVAWEPSCTFTPGQIQIHISGEHRHQVLKKNAKELDRFFDKMDRAIKHIESDFPSYSK